MTPNDARIFYIRHAFRAGFTPPKKSTNLTKIDPWFLAQLKELVDEENSMYEFGAQVIELRKEMEELYRTDKMTPQIFHERFESSMKEYAAKVKRAKGLGFLGSTNRRCLWNDGK